MPGDQRARRVGVTEPALVAAVADRLPPRPARAVVGLTGSVAVGKSTVADHLASELRDGGRSVELLAADAFLLPNERLAEAGLLMRKGFPETFDLDALADTLAALRAGRPASVPVYSHDTYDRVPGRTRAVAPADVVVVEGVVALHPALVQYVDVAVYLDAADDDARHWFTERFLAHCRDAEAGGAPFYRMFLDLDEAGRTGVAHATWAAINAVNLAEHIRPSQAFADVVATKDRSHRIVDVVGQCRTHRG